VWAVADHDGIAFGIEASSSSSATHLLVLGGIYELVGYHGLLKEDDFGWEVDAGTEG
jgi:hypothetical protein